MKTLIMALAFMVASTAAMAATIIQSGVPVPGGSAYGFMIVADGAPLYITNSRNAAGRELGSNVVVVDSIDIYDEAEVATWVNANFGGGNDYSLFLRNECNLTAKTRDPDGGAGTCFSNDGVVGTVGENKETRTRW